MNDDDTFFSPSWADTLGQLGGCYHYSRYCESIRTSIIMSRYTYRISPFDVPLIIKYLGDSIQPWLNRKHSETAGEEEKFLISKGEKGIRNHTMAMREGRRASISVHKSPATIGCSSSTLEQFRGAYGGLNFILLSLDTCPVSVFI